MFNEHSALVKIWVSMVKKGVYGVENIPNVSNLRDVVLGILEVE